MRRKYTEQELIEQLSVYFNHVRIMDYEKHSCYTDMTFSTNCRLCGQEVIRKLTRELVQQKTESCGCSRYLLNRHSHNWKGSSDGRVYGGHCSRIVKQASDRQLEFSVDIEYVANLLRIQEDRCAYTGLPIQSGGGETEQTASLDRIDSSKGYVEGNVQCVHKNINKMKGSLSEDRFVKLCGLVYNNTQEISE